MTQLAAVAPERHARKAWKSVPNYTFAAAETVMPLVGAELSQAASAMPIGFIKQEAGYQLAAITSLQPGQNLYVAPDGQWLGNYIPAVVRAYPFRLVQPESAEKSILCIDEAGGLVVEAAEGGNAFFDEHNQPTPGTREILNFLAEIERNRAGTQQAVNALADAHLITPWSLKLKQGEQIVPVIGLYHVDEAALTRLDDEAFLTLRTAGALVVAYAQLLSMNQITVLERLGRLRGQILARRDKPASPRLEGFSLTEENGTLESRSSAPLPAEISTLAALMNAGRYGELEDRSRSLIERYPDWVIGWKTLGASLHMQGKDSLPTLQKALQLLPDDAEAHNNLGVVLKARGRLAEAEASYRRALALKPDHSIIPTTYFAKVALADLSP